MIGYILDQYLIWRGGSLTIEDVYAPLPRALSFTPPPGPYDPGNLLAYVGGAWQPAVEPEPMEPAVTYKRTGDAGWFWLRLFTSTERAAWSLVMKHAAGMSAAELAQDPWLLAAYNADLDLQKAGLIDLDAPSVDAGVRTLCRHTYDLGGGITVTVLASDERRDQVLSGLEVS